MTGFNFANLRKCCGPQDLPGLLAEVEVADGRNLTSETRSPGQPCGKVAETVRLYRRPMASAPRLCSVARVADTRKKCRLPLSNHARDLV